MLEKKIEIDGRMIGPGCPVYVIAEISANHNHDPEQALKLIEVASKAGADAIKLQTYTADTLTIACDKPEFRISGGTPWDGSTLYDLYRQAYTPWEWQPKLKRAANDLGLHLFSTPFDDSAVQFLEEMGVPAHKVASFELVDLPLIERIARTGKPMIMSTGMASINEIDEAIRTAEGAGAREIALLKCTSAYPAEPEEMNLRTIPDMRERYAIPVGLSDHSMGIEIPVAAVALGACIIEKHITLSRSVPGPDAAFSLEPSELRSMVAALRSSERALGAPQYGPSSRESASMALRRSLYVVRDIRRGEFFSEDNIRSIRPSYGVHTRSLKDFVGRRATCDIERGTALRWEHRDTGEQKDS